ncbi:hypothetical protein BHM03_00001820 [Ensete ventricosum]|nr:hypothetical protein BHM03_00001820 [Ensete ventricosum]
MKRTTRTANDRRRGSLVDKCGGPRGEDGEATEEEGRQIDELHKCCCSFHRRGTGPQLPSPPTNTCEATYAHNIAIRSFCHHRCRHPKLSLSLLPSYTASSTATVVVQKFLRHCRPLLPQVSPSVRDRYLSVYNESFDRQNQADPSSHRNIGKKCSDAAASGTVTLGFLGFFCSSFFGAPYPVLLGSARGLHAAVIVLLVRRGRGRPRSGMALRRLRAFCSKESKPF